MFVLLTFVSGPQDAAGGYLKRQADVAVLRGTAIIQSAKDLYDFAKGNLQTTKSCQTKRRIFRYLPEINRIDSDQSSVKAVPQIRSIHQVRTGQTSVLTARPLSCYTCDNCLDSRLNEACKSLDETGQFRSVGIGSDCAESEELDVETVDQDDLVSTGMVIAVLADDPESEYFLLKVTKPPYTIRKPSNDSWGASYLAGSRVIGGLYYDCVSGSQLSYSLIKRKQAIVPAKSVVYICSELNSEVNMTVSEELHLDILERLHELKSCVV